ncbi:hypothetical protein [Thauera sinica]|uniref:Uncharacterized protein n=1 Tax=Thauera sinica TaxID=2665146 RepID=A0ABW1ALB2_9RHOO|nr:hypothetical protein [Thauera sp. K11]
MMTACGQHDPGWTTLALEPQDIAPLAWIDTNTLVVGHRDSIYRYDLKSRQLKQRLAEKYDTTDFQHSNCFSSRGGRFGINLPVRSTKSNVTIISAPKEQRFRHVRDWSRPELNTEDSDLSIWWNTNPLDCSPFDYKERERKVAILKRGETLVQSPRPLLLASEGDAFVTVDKSARSTGSRILHLFSHGSDAPSRAIPLPGATNSSPDMGSELHSFRDSDGSYVIYESNREFDANRNVWPLTAWRLAPDLTVTRVLMLPGGPWVRSHGLLKAFSCFSCGCSCYAHFDLAGAQGRIYAHIYGKSVGDSVAGVYELTHVKAETHWVQGVAGNFSGPILVSPEGCRIAYADADGRPWIVQVKSCK